MNPDGWQIATDNVRNISRPIYSNWLLYLYNEEDFSFLILISTSFFQITSLQVSKNEMLIDNFFLCLSLCLLFQSLVEKNIEIGSRIFKVSLFIYLLT